MEQDASIHTCSLMSNGVSGNDSGKHSVYRIDWFLDNITADRHTQPCGRKHQQQIDNN